MGGLEERCPLVEQQERRTEAVLRADWQMLQVQGPDWLMLQVQGPDWQLPQAAGPERQNKGSYNHGNTKTNNPTHTDFTWEVEYVIARQLMLSSSDRGRSRKRVTE